MKDSGMKKQSKIFYFADMVSVVCKEVVDMIVNKLFECGKHTRRYFKH